MRMVKSRYRMDDCMILCTQGDADADTKQPTDIPTDPNIIWLAREDEEDKGRYRYV